MWKHVLFLTRHTDDRWLIKGLRSGAIGIRAETDSVMKRERQQYWADHYFLSTRGLHYDFIDVATAQAFYADGVVKGFTHLIWEGSYCVIDTRIKAKPQRQ